jgi:hypothetical protein
MTLPVVLLVLVWLPGTLVGQEKQQAKQKKQNRQQAEAIQLFDGKSLEGWDYFLVDPDVKMEEVWSVRDGVLICKGDPLGYLHTKNDYKDFRLTLQWRWAPGKEPGNSGVLLRATGEPVNFMPKCVEAQLKHGSAGDIWGFIGFNVTGPQERFRQVEDHAQLGDFMGVAAMKNAEKEPGQWNTYRIVLRGGKLTLHVNGELVNRASDCDQVAGKIGLQSEGGEIHFRRIRIVPFD